MEDIRQAIREDRLLDFKEEFFEQYGLNVENPKTFKQEERINAIFITNIYSRNFAVMYFLMIRPQQKRAKQHRELINNIQSGQRITTIGGIKGTVKAVDETTVVITVNGHGTELTFENLQLNKLTLHNKWY